MRIDFSQESRMNLVGRHPGWLVILLFVAGCWPRSEQPLAPKPRNAYAVEELPAVEFNLPELDGGRIRIPTPTEWHSGSKRGDLVVWYFHRDRNGLPRIMITATNAPDGVQDTSADNIDAYVELVQAEVEPERDLVEPAKAIRLGTRSWVRYVLLGRTKEGTAVDRQFLRGIQGGRQYSIELQVLSGTIHQFKGSAYSIAAHLTTVTSDHSTNDLPGGGTPPGNEAGSTKESSP